MTARRGGRLAAPYVVTVRMEHFVNVHAYTEEDARRKALKAICERWGVGRDPIVTEVEAVE